MISPRFTRLPVLVLAALRGGCVTYWPQTPPALGAILAFGAYACFTTTA